jgi:hypothetical protein
MGRVVLNTAVGGFTYDHSLAAGVTDPFPPPTPGPSRERLAVRLGCTAVAAGVSVVVFRDVVTEALPLLWPPTDPVSRWVGLVTVLAVSFLVLPGVAGTLVADRLYDAVQDSPDEVVEGRD